MTSPSKDRLKDMPIIQKELEKKKLIETPSETTIEENPEIVFPGNKRIKKEDLRAEVKAGKKVEELIEKIDEEIEKTVPSLPKSKIKIKEKKSLQIIKSEDEVFELHKYDNIIDIKKNVRHLIKIFKREKDNLIALTPEVDIDEKFKELASARADLFSAFHEEAKEVWKKKYKINKINFITKLQDEVKFVAIAQTKDEKEDEEISKLEVEVAAEMLLYPVTVDDLFKKYQSYLYFEDKEFLEVSLATMIQMMVPGDPLWIYLIAPPGGTKTEIVRPYKILKNTSYTLDSLTPSTLISGAVIEKDGERIPIGGILEQLDGKVLVIKDFTTILKMPDIAKDEIFGQLRSCYDGYLEKAFGTMKKKVSIKSSFGILAAVTGAIDLYTKAHVILGERFLKCRHNPDEDKATEKALMNGNVDFMRRDIMKSVLKFFKSIPSNIDVPQIDDGQRAILKQLARYLASMRTHVLCKYHNGRIVSIEFMETEIPTRIGRQLMKLVQCLAIIRKKDEVTNDEIKTVFRVVRDSSNKKREKILWLLVRKRNEYLLPIVFSDTLTVHINTIKNELEKMEHIGILQKNTLNNKNYYRLSTKFITITNRLVFISPRKKLMG